MTDIDTWFAELDRFADVPILEDGRRQPTAPGDEDDEARCRIGRAGGGRAVSLNIRP